MKRSLLHQPIGTAAARHRGLRRLFEVLGLDYYCEGQLTIEEACRGAGVDLQTAGALIADAAAEKPDTNWDESSLSTILGYLEREHHAVTRGSLFRIGMLLTDACRGSDDPRLVAMRAEFRRLADKLILHMEREELTLFPAIVAMEEAWTKDEPPPPRFEGGIREVTSQMMLEHFEIGRALCELREMREAMADENRATLGRLFAESELLEHHVHEYMNLENYVIFPRAAALEDALAERMTAAGPA